METTVDSAREKTLQDYRKKLLEHKEVESRLKESKIQKNIFINLFFITSKHYLNTLHNTHYCQKLIIMKKM